MESNPYSSPAANLFGSTSGTSVESVSAGVINQLKRTKPWVRFMGVLLWIGVIFMSLAAAAMLLGGATMGNVMAQANPGMPTGFMTGIAVLYIFLAVLYMFPAIKIWKYGTSIGKLVKSGSNADLEEALNQQRGFWKFVGIMAIIMIVVYIVVMVGVAVFTFSAMAAGGSMPK